jgi:hypothetical protein
VNTIATWTVQLNCDCPGCKEWVDLLNYPDFFDGRKLDIGDHGTPKTTGMEVVCPECGHEFLVDLEY